MAQNRTETFLDFEHPTSDGVTTDDTNFVGGGWGASTVAHFASKVSYNASPQRRYNASLQSYSISPQTK